MTRLDHLLTILAEECAETAQRATKALRFGITEHRPGRQYSNAEGLLYEYSHIVCAISMLHREGVLPEVDIHAMAEAKRLQVEEYLRYSAEVGRLDAPSSPQPKDLINDILHRIGCNEDGYYRSGGLSALTTIDRLQEDYVKTRQRLDSAREALTTIAARLKAGDFLKHPPDCMCAGHIAARALGSPPVHPLSDEVLVRRLFDVNRCCANGLFWEQHVCVKGPGAFR